MLITFLKNSKLHVAGFVDLPLVNEKTDLTFLLHDC